MEQCRKPEAATISVSTTSGVSGTAFKQIDFAKLQPQKNNRIQSAKRPYSGQITEPHHYNITSFKFDLVVDVLSYPCFLLDDVEKERQRTYICSWFYKVQTRTTHPRQRIFQRKCPSNFSFPIFHCIIISVAVGVVMGRQHAAACRSPPLRYGHRNCFSPQTVKTPPKRKIL